MSSDRVSDHYAVDDLGHRVLAAVAASGADVDNLTIDDLAAVDAFHIRGRLATEELAGLANINPDDRVLDAGCGIGGTSRYLAATIGCDVDGVDLTPEYIAVARMLAARIDLAGRCDFRQGSVLNLPFEDGIFDVAWTEHVQMNVADKAGFYGELYRTLRPGGRLVFHDIFAGPEGEEYLPVPWAEERSISHLVPIEELRDVLGSVGFRQLVWEDKTGVSMQFFNTVIAETEEKGSPSAGLHLLMRNAATKFDNVLRNLREGRICVVQAVMGKPAGA